MIKKGIFYLILTLLIVSAGIVVNAQYTQKSGFKSRKAKQVPVESFNHTDIGNPAIAGTVKV